MRFRKMKVPKLRGVTRKRTKAKRMFRPKKSRCKTC